MKDLSSRVPSGRAARGTLREKYCRPSVITLFCARPTHRDASRRLDASRGERTTVRSLAEVLPSRRKPPLADVGSETSQCPLVLQPTMAQERAHERAILPVLVILGLQAAAVAIAVLSGASAGVAVVLVFLVEGLTLFVARRHYVRAARMTISNAELVLERPYLSDRRIRGRRQPGTSGRSDGLGRRLSVCDRTESTLSARHWADAAAAAAFRRNLAGRPIRRNRSCTQRAQRTRRPDEQEGDPPPVWRKARFVVPLGVSVRTAWGRQAEGQRASVGTCSSTRIWGRGRSYASTCVSIACIRDAPMPTNPRSPHRHRHVISPTPGRTPLPPTRSTHRKPSPSLHAPTRGPRRSTRQPPAR